MSFKNPVSYLRIGMPLSMIIASALSQSLFSSPFSQSNLLNLLRVTIFIALNFEAGRFIVLRIQERIPGSNQVTFRFIISYLACVAVSFLTISLSTLIARQLMHRPVDFAGESLINFTQCVWIAMLIVTPLEALYSYRLLYATQEEKNAIEKQNLQNQLQSLQEMISPHFLFNTLNTLSLLVTSDAKKAENYIHELSGLYRDMLVNNRKETITLNDELAFTKHYIRLVRERYHEGFEIIFSISERDMACSIVPLTLQILFENAIKHNALSPQNPLVVTVTSTDGWLVISNNLQPKLTPPLSSSTGLYSLTSRYRLLKRAPLKIERTDSHFSVHVPLSNQHHAHIDY